MTGFRMTFVQDGFCLFQKTGADPSQIRAVLVSHMDEIGGVALGPRSDGWFDTRFWGNGIPTFLHTPLQGFDWLAQVGTQAFPVEVQPVDEDRLAIRGDGVRAYRTGWTFRETAKVDGEMIEGKALDPRASLYAVVEAVREMARPDVAALCVMAEECAIEVARKAVTFLDRQCPALELVVNADVPHIDNLSEAKLDLPAIRVFEGRGFVDPGFGIETAERLAAKGIEFHLTAARTGSQTLLFSPLAPTISVALPGEGIHQPRAKMSLRGIERCQTLLTEIVRAVLGA
jgi:putative aminopeptidase FrvX